VRGPRVFPRLEAEDGVHVFVGEKTSRCLVRTSSALGENYRPPEGIHRRGVIPSQPVRRTYHLTRESADDAVLNRKMEFARGQLKALLERASRELVLQRADQLVER
jgi:hypothetical protein